MSEARTSGDCESSESSAAEVFLVIDTAALLAGEPEASCCYALYTGLDSRLTSNDGQVHLNTSPGDLISIRWSSTAVRGEQAVLLALQLPDDDVLTNLALTANPDATFYMPQMDHPGEPVPRTTLDAVWQAEVVTEGSVNVQVEATVTDRDAQVLGTFAWPLRIVTG